MTTTYNGGPSLATLRTSGISEASIQSTKAYLGSVIDNSANLDGFAHVELVWSYSVAPTANNLLKVHFLYAADGTNYEEGAGDGTTITAPLPGCQRCAVSPPADTSTHRKLFLNIPIGPFKFKPLVENNTTAQTSTVTLNIYTSKDQIVG